MNRKVKQTYRKILSFMLGMLIFLSGVPYMGAPMVAHAATVQWADVGSAGFSTGNVNYTSIAIDNSGTPYVVYQDEGNSYKATVMKYNGSSWENVGSAGFSTGSVSYPSIAIDGSGTPYVAYQNLGNGNKANVMKYNGSSWENVGSNGFSAGGVESTSIALDSSGTPYVVYRDAGSGDKATVMKFNGSSWVNVGSAGFSADAASYTRIAIDSSGMPYVVYMDDANSFKATVMRYNGGAWENAGSAGFSAGAAFHTSIAIDSNGTPYVVYQDGGNSNKTTVMRYNGSSWENVGSAGFSSGSTSYTNIAIDNSGTPYVVYQDGGSKATVMKYNGNAWENVGSAKFSAGTAIFTSIDIDSSGAPYVVYKDLGNGSKATVKKLTLTYNVTYNGNVATTGSSPTDSTMYRMGDTATVLGNTGSLVKTDYTFSGWNKKADGTGTNYVAGDPISISSDDVLLYAKWKITNAAAPSIGTQPTGATVNEGASSPSLSVTATVSDSGTLSYQWYSNTISSNSGGTAISGATSASYIAPTTTAGTKYYYVVVTNTNSSATGNQTGTATSSAATVTVNALINAATPSIGTQPMGATVNEGASSPSFSVAATVSDSGTLSYQWYSNTTSSNNGGTAINGATSASYAAPTTMAGKTYYYVVVTNTNGSATGNQTATATSNVATVTVNALTNAATPSIGTQPTGATVNEGASSPSLSVAATVNDGGTLSYQWYSNTASSNSGGTIISGATSASYAAPTTTASTTYYYVVVTNTNSSATGNQTATATSNAVTVMVNALINAAAPSIGTQPTGATVNEGASSPSFSVSATVNDGGTLSYQWYNNTTSSNSGGTAISGATSESYAAPTTTAGTTYYYVVVTNTNSSATGNQTATVTSGVATVTVNALTNAATPSIGTQPTGAMVNEGSSTPLSVAATVSDSGTLSYQWYSNTANSNSGGTVINGATSASYAAPTTTAGTAYYYVVVTNTNSSATGNQTATATSGVAMVTVNALINAATPSIGTQPTGATVNEGASAPLSVAATVSDSGTLSYQWYSNTTGNNSSGTSISGATSASYAAPTTTVGTTYYYVVATNTNSSATGSQTATATSDAVTVTVNALTNAVAPSIDTQPTGATVNEGASAPLSVVATVSDRGTLSYQWYSNTTSSNSGGTAISGATSVSYAAPTTTVGTTYYYVVVTNTNSSATGNQAATATSDVAGLTVNAVVISAPAAPTGLTAIAGNGQIDLAWNGVSESVTYSVYEGTDSGSYSLTPIATVSSATYSYTATGLTNDQTYYFAVKASNAGGSSSYSNEISATPKATPSGSSNANLSSMAVSGITLSPSFDTGTFFYNASVANGVLSVTVTPTISDSHATVKVNGAVVTSGHSSGDISLNVGNNTIDVEVTAQDGNSMRTYTVNVTRAELITASSSAPIQVTTDPVSIIVPANVANAEIEVATTTSGLNKEATLPLVDVLAITTLGNVSVTIPDGTTITAPANWDGTIKLPQVLSNGSVTISSGIASAVIEVGSTDVSITFDRAVRILFPNQGGKKAGFIQNGVLTEITGTVTSDTQAAADNEIAAGGDAKLTVGGDIVIWTKHFTQFVIYTQVNSTSNTNTGSGGGGVVANSATIVAASGGTITLNGATIEVPAGATDSNIQVTVDIVSDASILPMDSALQLVGKVYEIKKDKAGEFNKPIVITLPYDKTLVDFSKQTVDVYWLNEQTHQWVLLDSRKVDKANGTASGSVNRFAKFAVLALDKAKTEQPQTNEADFTDIIGHWSEANVRALVKLGAISGYPDHTFKPNANITRAEFVTVIVKAFHIEAQEGKAFADTETHWAKNAITTAASAGIVTGYSDNSFGPNDFITREQMAAIVVRAAKLAAADKSINFSDGADISEWAITALATATANGLINGYVDGTVKPKVNTTRAEAVTVIFKAIQVISRYQ
ncbi:S-layer homology domain-containing protein [Cohnella sp. WQ 127256]|uniref:S-layer homology domain-containing protein n=1 Tax=Cohnella sp. WQ 127256 TaxID=2938790 RepID=UPI00211880AE|nr:S-layer homology domain-containing protein [Cohnella sp. WQ 127256]